jgi:hypothetical protein
MGRLPENTRLWRRPLQSLKRMAAAVGESSMAIAFVHQYMRDTEGRSDPA